MELTRKELYDLVWAEPMTTICKRFGLSDNGLRKHCKSMNIPTPPAGYWAKIKFGKKVKVIPLPEDKKAKKQSTELHEVDPAKLQESPRIPEISRNKVRELEIRTGDLSVFAVPEVLYAKDPVIIDTKEKFRRDAENTYLKKSPYKSKIGPTLNVYVSEKSLDRALSIFSTIIKALRFRGHDVKISDDKTYAVINNEKIHVSITERKKRDPNSENPRNNYYNIYSGELHFNVYDDYRIIYSYKDTTVTKLEDKIVPIIADLEIRSEEIKEERIEAEKRRIQREKEEQERKKFEENRKSEFKAFKSLFSMAERLHKANILRQYIATFEEFAKSKGEIDEDVAEEIEWAKEKADWLDPFISRKDKYLDHYNKDEIIQPECPKKNTWDYPSYTSSSGNSFWSNPFHKRS